MPKLNRFKKNADAEKEIEKIEEKEKQAAIASTVGAIEGFVMCACIALGLLQICALRYTDKANFGPLRWLRTKREGTSPSEATMADLLRKTIFGGVHFALDLPIIRIIQSVQIIDSVNGDISVS